MTPRHSVIVAALLGSIAGCSDNNDPFGPRLDTAPPPPELGTQIDRMGRSAIATALIPPPGPLVAGTDASRKDEYNAAARADWGEFTDDLRTVQAIYDAVDGICGNQFLAGAGVADDQLDTPARYDALAGALDDDRLYLRADADVCEQYFAVELAATVLPGLETDCGGRTLLYDTVDVSYTALSNDLSVVVTDGIDQDDNPDHDNDQFPFLAPVIQ